MGTGFVIKSRIAVIRALSFVLDLLRVSAMVSAEGRLLMLLTERYGWAEVTLLTLPLALLYLLLLLLRVELCRETEVDMGGRGKYTLGSLKLLANSLYCAVSADRARRT